MWVLYFLESRKLLVVSYCGTVLWVIVLWVIVFLVFFEYFVFNSPFRDRNIRNTNVTNWHFFI